MKKSSFFLSLIFLMFSSVNAFADAEVDFVCGNLSDKTVAIKGGNPQLVVKALDFVCDNAILLKNNADFMILADAVLDEVQNQKLKLKNPSVSEKMDFLFNNLSDESVLSKIMDYFIQFPDVSHTININAYFKNSIQSSGEFSKVLQLILLYFDSNMTSESFDMLFSADMMGIWPENSESISAVYGKNAYRYEREILQMFMTVPVSKKIVILKKLDKNENISSKIRGELGENALSTLIYNTDDSCSEGERIELQSISMGILAETKWTRASALSLDFFPVAKRDYEEGKIGAESFSSIITQIISLGSDEMAPLLSSYLSHLNSLMEKGVVCDRTVILTVIKSLGELGDKTAFDYLLYVTHLDYPEEVRLAAKSALAKLKW